MSYGIPLGQAAGILAAIYAEGAVYQALRVQNLTLEDRGAAMYPRGKEPYVLNILSINCSRRYNTAPMRLTENASWCLAVEGNWGS